MLEWDLLAPELSVGTRWRAFHRISWVGKSSKAESSLWPNTTWSPRPLPWVLSLQASGTVAAAPVLLKKSSPELVPCEVHLVPLNNSSALEEVPGWRGQIQPLGAHSHDPEFQLNLRPSLDHSGQNPSIVSEHPSEKTKALTVMQPCSVRSGSMHRGLAQSPWCSLQWASFTLPRDFWLSTDFRRPLYLKRKERIISTLVQIPAASQISPSLRSASQRDSVMML